MLVAGLGNPGTKYASTRHNIGAVFLRQIAAELDGSFHSSSRHEAHLCELRRAGQKLHLLQSQTAMNDNGRVIAAFARYFRIPVRQILILHDELDLEPGTVQLKQGGGCGGHRGLEDLCLHLGERDFARLRLGIGRPRQREEVVSYVLSPPDSGQKERIGQAMERAQALLPEILEGRLERAMNRLHQRPSAPSLQSSPGSSDEGGG